MTPRPVFAIIRRCFALPLALAVIANGGSGIASPLPPADSINVMAVSPAEGASLGQAGIQQLSALQYIPKPVRERLASIGVASYGEIETLSQVEAQEIAAAAPSGSEPTYRFVGAVQDQAVVTDLFLDDSAKLVVSLVPFNGTGRLDPGAVTVRARRTTSGGARVVGTTNNGNLAQYSVPASAFPGLTSCDQHCALSGLAFGVGTVLVCSLTLGLGCPIAAAVAGAGLSTVCSVRADECKTYTKIRPSDFICDYNSCSFAATATGTRYVTGTYACMLWKDFSWGYFGGPCKAPPSFLAEDLFGEFSRAEVTGNFWEGSSVRCADEVSLTLWVYWSDGPIGRDQAGTVKPSPTDCPIP